MQCHALWPLATGLFGSATMVACDEAVLAVMLCSGCMWVRFWPKRGLQRRAWLVNYRNGLCCLDSYVDAGNTADSACSTVNRCTAVSVFPVILEVRCMGRLTGSGLTGSGGQVAHAQTPFPLAGIRKIAPPQHRCPTPAMTNCPRNTSLSVKLLRRRCSTLIRPSAALPRAQPLQCPPDFGS